MSSKMSIETRKFTPATPLAALARSKVRVRQAVEVLDCVGHDRAEFLVAVEARVRPVVARDRDRRPAGHPVHAELDRVQVEPQPGRRRDLLLGDAAQVGEEEVRLARAGQRGQRDAAAASDAPVAGQGEGSVLDHTPAGMGVYRGNVDAVQHRLVVLETLDDSADHPYVLVARHHVGMIKVVEVIGDVAIVLHDEARLAVL